MISVLMDEFNLCDIWRHFHSNLRQYTRHQRNPMILSRLDFILVSEDLINNCLDSKMIPGVQSNHSVVYLNLKDGQPPQRSWFLEIKLSLFA